MKKLCLSIALILLVLTAILLCTHRLESITDDMNILIDEAISLSEEKDYASAETKLQEALEIWHSSDPFTSTFLSHDEIEGMVYALYEAIKDLANEHGDAFKISSQKLKEQIYSLLEREHLSLSTLF